jgi:hypothetical protein
MTTQEQEAKRKQLLSDYRQTFGTEQGQRVIAHLRALTHLGDSHPLGVLGITDRQLVILEAKRELLSDIIKTVEANPDEPKDEEAITEKEE